LATSRYLALPFLCALAALAGAGLSGSASATTLASIAVEDGSTVTMANDTITIDGSLGGPHAGEVVVANGSRLFLDNVSLSIVSAPNGGIWVSSSALLSVNASNLSSEATSRFLLTITGGAVVELHGSQLVGLQALSDLSVPGILVEAGASLRADNSMVRVRPDVRPLLDANLATVEIVRSTVTGRLRLTQSSLTFRLGTLSVIGDTTAIESTASTVLVSNSTILATGGASAISAALGSSVTVLSTNVTAEDIGVTALSGSTVTLRGVVVDPGGGATGGVGAFGLVADGASLSGENLAVVGFPTALWAKGSQALLQAAQFGTGVLRLNASTAEVDDSPAIAGIAILEASSVLTLTDTEGNWSRLDVGPGSSVVPRYRPTFRFFNATGTQAAGVSWQVFPASGLAVGAGTSNSSGISLGPALEGPRFTGSWFLAAPAYRVDMATGTAVLSAPVTAWGAGQVFDFVLDASLPSLGFASGPSLSVPNPERGATFSASGVLTLAQGASPTPVLLRLFVDGTQRGVRSENLTVGAPFNVSFDLVAEAGFHLVLLQATSQAPSPLFREFSEDADNAVAIWYNASANTSAPVKPDLRVGRLWFEYENATGRDPVTGENRQALNLIVFLNISNAGLTGAGPFDVAVAAGINTSRQTVAGIGAQGSSVVRLSFGPYIESQSLNVFAQLDITDRVSEGNETNNQARETAYIQLPAVKPVERPVWVTGLVLLAAAALIGLSVWGVLLVFRNEEDEPTPGAIEAPKSGDEAGRPAGAPTGSSPAVAPAATQPASAPAFPSPPPAQPPYYPVAPQPSYYWGYPPYGAPGYPPAYPPAYPQAAPVGYPGNRYVPPPPLQPAPLPPPPPQAAAPGSAARPPARCPNCGSSQVSYLLHPERQVVCSNCGAKSPF